MSEFESRYAFLFVRRHEKWKSRFITSWEGDECSHVAIRCGQAVVHTTLTKGVHVQSLDNFLWDYLLVQEIPVIPKTVGMGEQAEKNLMDRIGDCYDVVELAGFPLLRDLGVPKRLVCSTLGRSFLEDATGYVHPGKRGRFGVRALRLTAAALAHGR